METTQDKKIREKLNSLDTLPDGYAPSLDSKWELLMAGQAAKPVKKAQQKYVWYAVAASFLLLLGLGFLFLKTEQEYPANAISKNQKTSSVTASAIAKTELPSPEIVKAEKIIAAPQKEMQPAQLSVRNNARNGMAKAVKTQNSTHKTTPFSSDKALDQIKNTQNSTEIPVLLAAEKPQTNQRKRSRYVELDFEAPATPQRLTQPVQTAQLQFKIRLPQPSGPEQTSAQQQNPLRLQHSF